MIYEIYQDPLSSFFFSFFFFLFSKRVDRKIIDEEWAAPLTAMLAKMSMLLLLLLLAFAAFAVATPDGPTGGPETCECVPRDRFTVC